MKKASHLGRPSWKSAVSNSLAAASRTRSVRPAKREDCEHDRKDEPRHVQGDLTGAVREGQCCCVSIEGRHDVSHLLVILLLAITIGAACGPPRPPAGGTFCGEHASARTIAIVATRISRPGLPTLLGWWHGGH